MANREYTDIDLLFSDIKKDYDEIIHNDLKEVISDEMLLELNKKRRKGVGRVYSPYDRHVYGVGLGYPADIQYKYLGGFKHAYIDVTPPNTSIFATSSNGYDQDKYLDDPYGADLSSWINDGLVPDIKSMYEHKQEIMSGEKRGIDFANQSYYKKGYLDDTQKYINKHLQTIINKDLRSRGYKVKKIR